MCPRPWDPRRAGQMIDDLGFRKAADEGSMTGLFSCSKATNELNYAAQKFSRVVLHSNNVDSCNRT